MRRLLIASTLAMFVTAGTRGAAAQEGRAKPAVTNAAQGRGASFLDHLWSEATVLWTGDIATKTDVPEVLGTPVQAGRDISTVGPRGQALLSRWLRHNAGEPADYLSSVIRKYPLVMIGENHQDRRLLTFVAANLGEFYRAGLRTLAFEVIKSDSSEKANRLVGAAAFDRALQLEIAREANWLHWNAQEQWDILEAVWRLNRSLPHGAQPLRVAGIEDGRIIFPYLVYLRDGVPMKPAERAAAARTDERAVSRDAYMAQEVAKIMETGSHALVLVGMHHAFTHYRQTASDGRQNFRMGNMLYERFPNRVFHVALHFPHEQVEAGKPAKMSEFVEDLARKAGLPTAGFDVRGTPFGELRDANSRYFRYATMYDLGDMADGYLWLGPLSGAPQCTRMKDFVLEETFLKWKRYFEIEVNEGLPLENVAELNKKLLEGG